MEIEVTRQPEAPTVVYPAHLAFEVPGEDTSNEWLEPVTDEEYDKLK